MTAMTALQAEAPLVGVPIHDDALGSRAVTSWPRPLADRAAAVDAARSIAGGIRDRAARTEDARSVAPENITALQDAGLFHVLTPARWGGSQLGFDTLLATQAEIAAACGSTGWVYGVLAGHAWLMSFFPEEAQREVFTDPRSLVASLVRLGGTSPEAVPGGYRWRGGRGRFCSGIDHSDWVMVGGQVTAADGTVDSRYFLIPRSDVEVIDDWHTVGLRGTGSRSLHVPDAFIPEYRTVRFADMAAGTAAGSVVNGSPFYRLPYLTAWPLSLAGAPLGLAREALNQYVAATRARIAPLPPIAQAAQGTALARLAQAAAMIDAATGLLMRDAEQLNEPDAVERLDAMTCARYRRNLAWAVQECRKATNDIYEGAGGSGVYTSSQLQRVWRDINAAASHFAFTWDLSSVSYGRAAAGLDG